MDTHHPYGAPNLQPKAPPFSRATPKIPQPPRRHSEWHPPSTFKTVALCSPPPPRADPESASINLISSTGTSIPFNLAFLNQHTSFFSNALSPTSGFLEYTTKSVTFPTYSTSVLFAFHQFCTTGTYTSSTSTNANIRKYTARLDMQVHRFANYILAEKLKTFAFNKLLTRLRTDWEFWSNEFPELVDKVYSAEDEDNEECHELIVDLVATAVDGGRSETCWDDVWGVIGEKHGKFSAGVMREYEKKVKKREEERRLQYVKMQKETEASRKLLDELRSQRDARLAALLAQIG